MSAEIRHSLASTPWLIVITVAVLAVFAAWLIRVWDPERKRGGAVAGLDDAVQRHPASRAAYAPVNLTRRELALLWQIEENYHEEADEAWERLRSVIPDNIPQPRDSSEEGR